jgi:hypothetical protein
MAGWS